MLFCNYALPVATQTIFDNTATFSPANCMLDKNPKLRYFAVFLLLFLGQFPAFGLFLWHLNMDTIRVMSNETGILPQTYSPWQM